ncbi:MAG: hypothetical protein LQ342_001562 [Letrouitia transgressa]|nr:MAG: hypothetical protein LQ342_001562 [Letrouitia transgressa]
MALTILQRFWRGNHPASSHHDMVRIQDWFTEPYLGNNWNFAMGQVTAQLNANKRYYPAKGFPVYPTPEYPHRMYDQAYMDSGNYTVQPLDDWVKGQEPDWEPIAGGART